MKYPLVTIVTPSMNQGRFIRATIESVLSQDYPNIEYIIEDGGSNDETAAIAAEYADRLTFISEKDRGQSHAINKGFRRASGTILAWINSDDVLLPGAVSKAVNAFRERPWAAAIYGEGYLIDAGGAITSRFPYTEPLNLWKLIHLSDYILQQSVFFRSSVIQEVGYLDENLHYTMDWDILIRIAKRWPLEYVPEYFGCLREYSTTKSAGGGTKRAREIGMLLRRHTGMWLPPGHVVYGLDTYRRLWMDTIGKSPSFLQPVSRHLQNWVSLVTGVVIGYTVYHSQGYYQDRWAGKTLHYMLPPGRGQIQLGGTVPGGIPSLNRQILHVGCNGRKLEQFPLEPGKFDIRIDVPEEDQGRVLSLKLRASNAFIPNQFQPNADRRRLAYLLNEVRWTESAAAAPFGVNGKT
jgi:glycosyltransferase involved in cell wall biosynthesis